MLRLAALALVLVLLPAAAQAAPSPQAMKEAKAHFAQGKAYQDAGAWDDAIKEYEAAYKLAPLPQLLFNVGQCYRLKGDKPKALEAYQRFIDVAPDGPGADDARDHVASLKLRIQVEQAEAAQRKATEDAEAARKQAADAEAARKRMEAEDAARAKASGDAEARLHHVAEQMAEAERKKRADDEAAQRKRVAAAENVGRPLRIAGGAIAGAGVVVAAFAFVGVADAIGLKDKLNSLSGQWGPEGMQTVARGQTDSQTIVGTVAAGGALIVAGAAIGITGAVLRSRAVERVQARVAPIVLPGGGGLVAGGRF